MPNCRLAETHAGDTLARVAARELGNANLWIELAWVNGLTSPYITNDPDEASDTVLLAGSLIRIPAPVDSGGDTLDRGLIYERDCALSNRRLVVGDDGDFAVSSGTENLKQQLKHRIVTPRGQLSRHPEYGCLVWLLQGKVTGPLAAHLGAAYVKSAVESDYRVTSVTNSTAEIVGDTTRVTAVAEAIAGGKIDISN